MATPASLVWLKALVNGAVDLLFPPHCIACQRFGAWLCTDCAKEIEIIRPPICSRCGLPLEGKALVSRGSQRKTATSCSLCRPDRSQMECILACAFHSGPLRTAIHQLKYEDLRALAAPLGQLMADGWAALSPDQDGVEAIVPVPLHATRQRQRGYNQAALLARALGPHLHLPVVQDSLVRVKATIPQVGLDAHARWSNVQDAFQCVDRKLAGRRVLLVDDVFTTGSTLEAAAAALREGGASSVWAYTLARAKGSVGPGSG
jgi:ComF family protein